MCRGVPQTEPFTVGKEEARRFSDATADVPVFEVLRHKDLTPAPRGRVGTARHWLPLRARGDERAILLVFFDSPSVPVRKEHHAAVQAQRAKQVNHFRWIPW